MRRITTLTTRHPRAPSAILRASSRCDLISVCSDVLDSPCAAMATSQSPVAQPADVGALIAAAQVAAEAAVLTSLSLTEVEIEAGLVALESDLSYVLEGSGVEAKYRGFIGHLGLTRLNVFAMLAPSEERMADVIKEDFGLDPRAGVKARVQHAMLLDAWDRAKKRVAAQATWAAEASAAG